PMFANRLTSACKRRSILCRGQALERSAAMKFRIFVSACVALLAAATSAKAQQEVKIGVLYPLSGPTAQIGIDAVAAVKTAVEIVNQGADLPLALAKNTGLPGLRGGNSTRFIVAIQGTQEASRR